MADIGGGVFEFNHCGRLISAYAVYHPAHRYDHKDVEEVYEDAAEEIDTIFKEFRAQPIP